jgi:hypothetical protein
MQPWIADRVMKHFSRINIVHHVPGRLRLHIPLLERLDPEWQRYEAGLLDLVKLEKGLTDLELSILTGRALIRYDHCQTDKEKILRWLRKLALMLYGDFLAAPSESRRKIDPFLKKVHTQYRRLLKRNHNAREVL